jgi:hypothetical protein
MGAADTAGDADAGDGLLEATGVDDLDDVDDVDDLEAGDMDAAAGLDLAGVVRAGELCAWANVNGASARVAMAINETVDFMTILSLFRLRRGSSGTQNPVRPATSKSMRLDPRVSWERLLGGLCRRQ